VGCPGGRLWRVPVGSKIEGTEVRTETRDWVEVGERHGCCPDPKGEPTPYIYIRQNSPCHVRSKCQPNAVKVVCSARILSRHPPFPPLSTHSIPHLALLDTHRPPGVKCGGVAAEIGGRGGRTRGLGGGGREACDRERNCLRPFAASNSKSN